MARARSVVQKISRTSVLLAGLIAGLDLVAMSARLLDPAAHVFIADGITDDV
jgi:hypothetical protein